MQSPGPGPERCSGVHTRYWFLVLPWALPFALGTQVFGYVPLNPWGAPAPAHTSGAIDSSAAPELGVTAGICRVGVPVPGPSTFQCSRGILPLVTSPVSPFQALVTPRRGWVARRTLLSPSPFSSGTMPVRRPFPRHCSGMRRILAPAGCQPDLPRAQGAG